MGSVRLYGATSGYLELQAPDVAPDSTLVLPSDSVQPGLVHLHTETFSGVSSVSIDDVFSSTYDSYHLIFAGSGTTSTQINIYLTSNGVSAGGATDYENQQIQAQGSTLSAANFTEDSFRGPRIAAEMGVAEITIHYPAATSYTFQQCFTTRQRDEMMNLRGGIHLQAVSYDGVKFALYSGSMTGSLSIYGYRNN